MNHGRYFSVLTMGRLALAGILATGLVGGTLDIRGEGSIPEREYWPTKSWNSAAPELHGIDTNRLAKILKGLPWICPDVGSLLVVRHGKMVVEKYFNGRTEHDYWNIKSASKSILSALV